MTKAGFLDDNFLRRFSFFLELFLGWLWLFFVGTVTCLDNLACFSRPGYFFACLSHVVEL